MSSKEFLLFRNQDDVPREAPRREIRIVRDFLDSHVGAKAALSEQLGERGTMPRRQYRNPASQQKRLLEIDSLQCNQGVYYGQGAEYYHPNHYHRGYSYYYRELYHCGQDAEYYHPNCYHGQHDYYGQEEKYYHLNYYHRGELYQQETSYYHHDINGLSRPRHWRATTSPSGHLLIGTTSRSHHNQEDARSIALGNRHLQSAITLQNPRPANLANRQKCPSKEHHRKATASPSNQSSGGQSGENVIRNDQTSTVNQSKIIKHQPTKVQPTHSSTGINSSTRIESDGCQLNAESINPDVSSKIISRRPSAVRTFPAGCGRAQNVSKKVAIEVGVGSSGSYRFPVDQNVSNSKKDTEVSGVASSKSGRRGKGQKISIQVPDLQLVKREDPEVIDVDLSSGADKEKGQVKDRMMASKEVATCSTHSSQARDSPSIEEKHVEVIGVDSPSALEEEPQSKEVTTQKVTEEKDHFNDVMSSSLQKNADEVLQFEAEKDARIMNREHVPEPNKEMEMHILTREHEYRSGNEMDLDEKEDVKVTKRKRKEDGFKILPFKKRKHKFLVCNTPQTIVPINTVAPTSIVEIGDARKKVMETLFQFRSIYDEILQQKDNIIQSNLLAYNVFKEKFGGSTSAERFVGNVPGVHIGDEFRLRAEMFIIGLHRQHQAGIDYIKQHGKDVAVSIVSSGRYANTQTDMDVLLYSGAGVSHEDQKLTRGNLALKNSIDEQIPIRVIYGVNRYSGRKRTKTYVYDGLYLAENYSFGTGNRGHSVLIFQLRRIPGQPEITIGRVQWPKSCISSMVSMDDISEGAEDIPIRLVNDMGRDFPEPFKYTKKMILPSSYSPIPPTGCSCDDGCYDSKRCTCAANNGGKFLFNCDGAIIRPNPLVYECGPSCRCPPTCPNRVSQHGIKLKLEVFKTESRGWGVRSPNMIPSGSFVCEYVGEILGDEEAQRRDSDEYLFGMGQNYNDKGHPSPIPSLSEDASSELVEGRFTVDAMRFGNVGRFINHSCSPNLYAQNVLYDHDDIRMPHIMLFACNDIEPFEELTYDYNYAIDQVHDSKGNIKKKECHCGSEECTGWLY